MFQALVSTAGRLLQDFKRWWIPNEQSIVESQPPSATVPAHYEPLKRVVLADEVSRTLFEEYEAHRKGSRGHEETGWVILGVREKDEAVVLATLPAGTDCSAGVAHVHFNSGGQALASRIVRQTDRRLTMLGVVHTHPGSLRHPSDGDYRGDSLWVGQLRGGEGIFGIGTAEDKHPTGTMYAQQPKPNVQCLGDMCLSWYALKKGDRFYRPMPSGMTLGPDLARSLHPLWATIEAHAEPLDRLVRQQKNVTFEVVASPKGPALAVNIALAEPEHTLRILISGKEVRFFLTRDGDIVEAAAEDTRVDRGVYLLLAALAAQN